MIFKVVASLLGGGLLALLPSLGLIKIGCLLVIGGFLFKKDAFYLSLAFWLFLALSFLDRWGLSLGWMGTYLDQALWPYFMGPFVHYEFFKTMVVVTGSFLVELGSWLARKKGTLCLKK